MHVSFWQIAILAVIQGITEFLPISSDGHLVLTAALLGMDTTSGFDVADTNIVLHIGTLMSILVLYAGQIRQGILFRERALIPLLIVATVPAVLVGVPVKLAAEGILESIPLTGAMLIVTGLVLVWSSFGKTGNRIATDLTWREAVWIGIAQATAILPGLSRSGTTIATGLRLGLSPDSAATFSFLLAIPVISGAGLLEAVSLIRSEGTQTPWFWLMAGTLISFVVGLFALSWLQRWLECGKFQSFAWWCIPLGAMILIAQWFQVM